MEYSDDSVDEATIDVGRGVEIAVYVVGVGGGALPSLAARVIVASGGHSAGAGAGPGEAEEVSVDDADNDVAGVVSEIDDDDVVAAAAAADGGGCDDDVVVVVVGLGELGDEVVVEVGSCDLIEPSNCAADSQAEGPSVVLRYMDPSKCKNS